MVEILCKVILVTVLLDYIQAAKEDRVFRCSDNGTYDSLVCSSSLGKFETCSLQDSNSIITRLMINGSDSRCSEANGNYSFDAKQLRLTVYNGCVVIAELCKNVSDTVTSSNESAQTKTTVLKVAILIPVILFVGLMAVLVSACIIYRRKDRCACCRKKQLFRNMKPFTGDCSWLTDSSPGPVYAVPLVETGSAKTTYSEEVYCVADDGTKTPFPDPTYDHSLVNGSYDICSIYGNHSDRKTLHYIAVVNQKPCKI